MTPVSGSRRRSVDYGFSATIFFGHTRSASCLCSTFLWGFTGKVDTSTNSRGAMLRGRIADRSAHSTRSLSDDVYFSGLLGYERPYPLWWMTKRYTCFSPQLSTVYKVVCSCRDRGGSGTNSTMLPHPRWTSTSCGWY